MSFMMLNAVLWTFHFALFCQVYLTKSGLMVFGFCPAGSTISHES